MSIRSRVGQEAWRDRHPGCCPSFRGRCRNCRCPRWSLRSCRGFLLSCHRRSSLRNCQDSRVGRPRIHPSSRGSRLSFHHRFRRNHPSYRGSRVGPLRSRQSCRGYRGGLLRPRSSHLSCRGYRGGFLRPSSRNLRPGRSPDRLRASPTRCQKRMDLRGGRPDRTNRAHRKDGRAGHPSRAVHLSLRELPRWDRIQAVDPERGCRSLGLPPPRGPLPHRLALGPRSVHRKSGRPSHPRPSSHRTR